MGVARDCPGTWRRPGSLATYAVPTKQARVFVAPSPAVQQLLTPKARDHLPYWRTVIGQIAAVTERKSPARSSSSRSVAAG